MANYREKNFKNKTRKLYTATPIYKSEMHFIMDNIFDYDEASKWNNRDYTNQMLHFVTLSPNTAEYEEVEDLFNDTAKECFEVTKVERVQNPYLMAAYLLKKEEMIKRFGFQDVEKLFHGTKRESVLEICSENFNWRYYGDNFGHKFGQGISFTPDATYATHYGNDNDCHNRVMILANVMTGDECIGNPKMTLPDEGTDTSIKPNRDVIVKYEDNEFYPSYKITYCCNDPQEFKRRNKSAKSKNKN